MTALYILCAVVGLPLVAYAVLAGDGDGELGEASFDTGGIVAYLSLGTLAFFAGFFGLAGLAGTWSGSGAALTLVLASVAGLAAAGTHRGLLRYIQRTSVRSHVSDADLVGKAATVVIPLHVGKRGRIALQLGEQRCYLTAELTEGGEPELEVGSSVVVVEVAGGVAHVTHLDPDLA
jgi:membrane protein implicated in regulation of membrane protease activity